MIGQTISRYKILSKLGEGGMGQVYLAEDTELGRQVALKVLPPALAEAPERLERFRREARAVAALNHPNIVTIFNVEEVEGQRLLIMELVSGKSLDQLIPPQGLPLPKVFEIAIPMADALAAAHERGITHRDLKPANVMVTDAGQVKVLDFGLAKLAAEAPKASDQDAETELAPADAPLTGEGVVMGTAPYMSPEQLQGLPVDSRTDVFSLGIVLYEMVTGERPFQGKSGLELASSILKDAPSSVTENRADLPRHLGRIIQHCLEKDPERRFQSVKDVRNELETIRDEVQSGVGTGSRSVVQAASPAGEQLAQPAPPTAPLAAPSDVASGPATAAPVPDSTASGALQTPAPPRGRKRALAAAVLIVVVAGAWWLGRGGKAPSSPAQEPASVASSERTLAVLPFVDLSPEKDQEYFTDGMTEELLSALGRVDGIRVPSRTAIFALKDKGLDIGQVGERLGVETVLEGSVRKSGNRLRISTQLVQVSDGFQLWSEVYDRELQDVFSVQEEIAQSIAAALRVTLAAGTAMGTELGGTDNSEAYDFLLQGNQYLDRDEVDLYEYAVQMYEKALELDPEYALAWARLAYVKGQKSVWQGDTAALHEVDSASLKAIDLEPRLSEGHLARALYLFTTDQDDAAIEEFAEAVRLDDQNPILYWHYGNVYYTRGDLEPAAELWEKAVEVDPENTRIVQILPQIYVSMGREDDARRAYERALEVADRFLELNPDSLAARLNRASGLMALGRREEAFEQAQSVIESGSRDQRVLYNTACFYSLAGEVEPALETLKRTVDAGYAAADWARNDSDLDNIRQDPRFQRLLEQMEANSREDGADGDPSTSR